MLPGMRRSSATCHPAPSITIATCSSGARVAENLSRKICMASVETCGNTSAKLSPVAGCTAANRCKRVYDTIGELQADLDLWIDEYNQARTHQGRYCFGKTPMQTFLDATPLARDKQIGEAIHQTYAA